MKLSDYRESIELQTKGAPLPVDDAVFYIRRFGTPESNEVLKDLRINLFGPIHRLQDVDNFKLYGHWLAEYGCTGWDGCVIDDATGEPITYSKKSARGIFTSEGFLMSINSILIDGACYFQNYLHEEAEKDTEALKKK